MERNEIKNIRSNYGGMDAHKAPIFLKALDLYIESLATKLIQEKYSKIIKPKHIRVISKANNTVYAHFIDNEFRIYFYETKSEYEQYRPLSNIRFNINELFGNCSTAVINNMELNGMYGSNKHPEYFELGLTIAEDLADLFGYTCVTYSVSADNSANLLLEPYLAQSYAIVDQYVNKRGGLIKIFNKLI